VSDPFESPEAETARIIRTGTIWLAAAVVAPAVALGPLLASGWRPSHLPVPAAIIWWIGVVAAGPIFERLPRGALAWLFAGGLAYTGGVVFYLWDRLPFNHAVWHLFVLSGSLCHFVAVLIYVVPAR